MFRSKIIAGKKIGELIADDAVVTVKFLKRFTVPRRLSTILENTFLRNADRTEIQPRTEQIAIVVSENKSRLVISAQGYGAPIQQISNRRSFPWRIQKQQN
jgi:hypothetical protein